MSGQSTRKSREFTSEYGSACTSRERCAVDEHVWRGVPMLNGGDQQIEE